MRPRQSRPLRPPGLGDEVTIATQWQWSRHPEVFRPRIVVQHEGIELGDLGPDPETTLRTPSGVVLKAGDPVVTYVARNLEPYRGFHVFMRALAELQRQHSTVHALIVGGDEVSYGKRPADAPNWREKMLREVTLDPLRTHFMGKLPRLHYLKVLQLSACHVYLTYPFVLSWSLLEAVACGVPLVASGTAPVRDVLSGEGDAALVDFFDRRALVEAVRTTLDGYADVASRGERARQAVGRFDRRIGEAAYTKLLAGPPGFRLVEPAGVLARSLAAGASA
jgi:hypothetical protein